MRRRPGAMGTALMALAVSSQAQDKDKAPRYATGTELLQIEVAATDKSGKPVLDLRPTDFVVIDDGLKEAVTHLVLRATPRAAAAVRALETHAPAEAASLEERPRQVLIVVDDGSFSATSLLAAKSALVSLVNELLDPEDAVGIVATTRALGPPVTLSADRALVRAAIERLSLAPARAAMGTDKPPMSAYQADLILRNDRQAREDFIAEILREDPAMPPPLATSLMESRARQTSVESAQWALSCLRTVESAARGLAGAPGRRQILLLSDGFFLRPEDNFDLRTVTSAAARSGVAIDVLDTRGLAGALRASLPSAEQKVGGNVNALLAMGRYSRRGFEADRDGLNALARDTGGTAVFNTGDLGQGLKRILDESEATYLLAYSPTKPAADGRYRKIEVQVPGRADVRIRSHRGYFARSPKGEEGKRAKAEGFTATADPGLRTALTSVVARNDLPMELAAGHLVAAEGPVLIVDVRVPGPHPPCADGNPRPCPLELLGVLYDGAGKPLRRFEDRRDLESGTGTVSMAPRSPVAAGSHVVRVAVRSGNRVANGAVAIDIPDLAQGQFALSDLFVSAGGQDSMPAPDGRAFARDAGLEFVVFAYNAAAGPDGRTDVVFGLRILSGDKAVVDAPPTAMALPAGAPLGRMAFSRRLDLQALDPGEYTLVVTADDKVAGATRERRLLFRVP